MNAYVMPKTYYAVHMWRYEDMGGRRRQIYLGREDFYQEGTDQIEEWVKEQPQVDYYQITLITEIRIKEQEKEVKNEQGS